MRLARVDIERFLGFNHLTLEVDRDLQLIAGPNNAGKSSLVRLLEAFFIDPQPSELLKMLPLNAYYKALGPRTLSTMQLWFDQLTPSETAVFESGLRKDGLFWIKLRCSRGGSISYRASQDASAEESRRLYDEVLNRVHFVQIPSIRIGGQHGKDDVESMERLIDTLESVLVRTGSSRSTSLQQEFKMRMQAVEGLVSDVLNQSAAAIMSELPFRESKVNFKLPGTRHALRAMLDSTAIESEGEVVVPVSERGTGFQSALVLGILRHVASQQAQGPLNTIFAIEEPEAFLHPQTQRAMAKIIADISADAQVLLTTHSPVFVNSYRLSQVTRLPLQPAGMEHVWQIPELSDTDEGRLTRYCTAANSELVFANAVIFVEGEGDKAVVERILDRVCNTPGGYFALGITVIDAVGLGKIRYLVQLAELFGVTSYVMVDRDSLDTGSGKRELLDILKERVDPPDTSTSDALIAVADKSNGTLRQAIRRQARINKLLDTYGAFVLSSDLEGLFLDMLGVEGMVQVLGPSGQQLIDAAFVERIRTDPQGYDLCAAWMGSRGWNSDRKKSNKLPAHVPRLLLDQWFEDNEAPGDVLQPLYRWLTSIVNRASLAPI